MTAPLLQEKANEFAIKLNLTLKSTSVSASWILRFKERHGIAFRSVSGEAGAVNHSIVNDWIQNVWPSLKQGYQPDDIFNADECGLFYKLLPERSLAVKSKLILVKSS